MNPAVSPMVARGERPQRLTLRVMDPVPLALLALFAGVLIGIGIGVMLLLGQRAAMRARTEVDATVPDAVHHVLAAMEGAAAVVDASLTVVAASPVAPQFGMTAGEAVAAEDLRALARAARTAGHPEQARFRMRRAAGPSAKLSAEGRLVAARAAILDPRHVLIVVDDVTEQERLEQMRYDFVANTSHELKTPVGAVSLLSEAIESAADDPDQVRAFAARLQAESARLARLTSRIMDLSRLQSADALPEPRKVAIDEIVASVVEAHVVQADSAGVELVRGGERGLCVLGEPAMLIDAVGNLIANAIVYSPRGGRVGIGVRADEGVVEISVSDQGVGIAEIDQQRIFERFYRADVARSRRTGGTGLGLAIVKHVVQRHGGEVRVWSRLGNGSTFTIRLPRLDAVEPVAKKGKGRGKAGTKPGGRAKKKKREEEKA